MTITSVQIHQPAGLLRLRTDTDHEGWCPGVTPEAGRMLLTHCADAIIGADAVNRERIWQELLQIDQTHHTTLRGYIDVALWDLNARAVDIPVYRYINGFRDRALVYLCGNPGLEADQAVLEAVQAQKDGLAGYKVAVRLPVREMAALLRDLRQAVGDGFYLMLEGHQAYTVADAIRIGRVLDETDVCRFDRPRPNGDLIGSKEVADNMDTPVTMDAITLLDASQILAAQAADHLRAGVPQSGGITDVLKIARCAEAFGAHCHLSGAGLAGGFVHVHLLCAIKNAPFYETYAADSERASPLLRNPIRIEGGYVRAPSGPGLGIDLDPNALERHTEEVMEAP